MGSRVGSIAILMVIGGIVAAVVIVISRLDLLDTGEPDAPVMVLSIDEGELVLLNEPLSITVTISSGNPIATLELFADEVSIASILPAYSADRGAFIGSFVWTPDRLGFADVRIVALDDQGVESSRTIRVEVTDDQARVAAALRVQVFGIAPLQQFVAGTEIKLAISATGNQPIERFDMLVNDEHIVSVTPLRQDTGEYIARIDWTANEAGEMEVRRSLLSILPGDRNLEPSKSSSSAKMAGSPASGRDDQPSEAEPAEQDQSEEPASGDVGVARIESPQDGQRFTLDSDLSIDVELAARNVGAVASALLYITPVAPDNTLGSSVLIHSSEGHAPGDYSERIADVERWITSSGSYELQLVVFTPDDERYDDRIMIHIVAVADRDDDSGGDVQQDDAPPASDEIDLAIVTARQADDDRQRLNVSITNQSTVDIELTDVVITVVDARDGAELASAAVTLGIESDALRTIPLDLDLEPGVDIEAFVLLEALADTDTSNNRLSITLTAPSDGQPEQGGEQQSEQQESQDRPDPAGPSPDLTFLDVQATNDGYILMTIINNGAGTAETFFIVITDQSGEQLETISRRDGDAQSLGPGETQILTSLQPHSGTVDITVVVGGDSVEQDLDNNRITFQIPG